MKRLLFILLSLLLAVPTGMLLHGYVTFRLLERSIVEKMDQYYLNISTPGREKYLLESDEVFEVPYMASTLSVDAQPTRIYDARGRLIGEFAGEKNAYVRDPAELPAFLKKALVATEDGTFYQHRGVNPRAIARAALVNLRSLRAKQGGSTLTQQLAKLMFTTRKKTVGRKIFEALCALKLESKFTKDQILLMYLNFVYFGHGCFGIDSAARYYFDKPARNLELAEAALLAGMVASPNNYSPYENTELARARHRTVLTRMAKLGFIPSSAVDRYSEEFWKTMDLRLKAPEVSFWKMTVNQSPYLVEHVRRGLEKEYSKERILKGGLKIHTTFDIDVQKAAEAALREGLREENRAQAEKSSGTAVAPIEGALAAVRPSDGAILALVGGRSFDFSNQLNRAIDCRRPAGSSIKPFVFAQAFESGKFSPEDKMIDAPVKFRNPGGKAWSPRNYGDKYYGEVTLREALRRSLNSVAVNLLRQIDIDALIRLLSDATGAPRERFPRDFSLALGSADLSPLEAAAGFAVFAGSGTAITPYAIRLIEDRNGAVLRDARAAPPAPKRVLSPATCAAMVDVLRGVFKERGTAHAAARLTGFNIPAGGKTGTTSESRDAWFIGFTPDLSASVWMGHDDMRVALDQGKTGGSIAAPVWMRFVKAVYRDKPTREFDNAVPNR